MQQRMMEAWPRMGAKLTIASMWACLAFATPGFAGSPERLAGEIFGQVRNSGGVAQMGATVNLYNRFDELVSQGFSNEQGRFAFLRLVPDVYTVRVLLASFVPAERRNIAVLPSTENRLEIHLNSVLSTVELTSAPSSQGYLMSDDWKWVLRSSQATRPALRLLPSPDPGVDPNAVSSTASHLLLNTTGVVKLSGGESQSLISGAGEDLGTGFSIATSLADASRLQLSGTFGYSADTALPAGGIRTSYNRTSPRGDSHPEFVLTARQVYLAMPAGAGASVPALRTLSAAFIDRFDFSNAMSVDYGVELQSVSYVNHVGSASPFARVTYNTQKWGRIRVAASSGARPGELAVRDREQSGGIDQDLAALAILPSVARANGRLTMERSQNVELGWDRTVGSRTYSAGVYDEVVANAAFMLSGNAGILSRSDLLPDLSSKSSIFDLGSYHRTGVQAAIRQALGAHSDISLSGGRTGALAAGAGESSATDSQSLRAGIQQVQRNWAAVRVSSTVSGTRTHVAASYGWTDAHTLMPTHLFVTQDGGQDVGLNFVIRQPLPFVGVPWHLEATAELRNLLAQGYLPLGGTGTNTVLTSSPRAMRGGLSISF